MGRFTAVEGQYITVQRPADGYLAVIDHKGRVVCMSEHILLDGDAAAPVGELLRHTLTQQPIVRFEDDRG